MAHEKKITGVLQRKGRPGWYARVIYNGKMHWRKCDSKADAKLKYWELLAEVKAGALAPTAATLTLKAWIDSYLAGSTNIGKDNEVVYAARWIEAYGERLLSEFTNEDVRHMQATMRATVLDLVVGQRAAVRRWSDATINRHLAFIRRVCTLAVHADKIRRNPVSGIEFFPEAPNKKFFSVEELTQIEAHMRPEDWTLVAIAYETGMRRGEQFQLRWEQVDLENEVITIPIAKSGKTHHVFLTPDAVALFRSLDSFGGSAWVFPGTRKPDAPMDIRAFMRRAYNPALRRAGITGANWHTLRHTFASHHVMKGTGLRNVQLALGHADYATTERYAHLDPAHLRGVLGKGSLQAELNRGKADAAEKRLSKCSQKCSQENPKLVTC